METNSPQYWDHRFGSGDWAGSQGREQTVLFAHYALKVLLDHPLMEDIRSATSFHDVGCAEGDATLMWQTMLGRKRVKVSGSDFSAEAVASATDRWRSIDFHHVDLQDLSQDYDVTYCSNVLEHFADPWMAMGYVLGHTKKLSIFMVPWQEHPLEPEHEYSFNHYNLKLVVGDFKLVKFDILNIDKPGVYTGKQALLVYERY